MAVGRTPDSSETALMLIPFVAATASVVLSGSGAKVVVEVEVTKRVDVERRGTSEGRAEVEAIGTSIEEESEATGASMIESMLAKLMDEAMSCRLRSCCRWFMRGAPCMLNLLSDERVEEGSQDTEGRGYTRASQLRWQPVQEEASTFLLEPAR